jgi:transposase
MRGHPEEKRLAKANGQPGAAEQMRALESLAGRLVAAWMSERLGRPVGVQRGWDYLQRLGQSPQMPRQRHVHADPAAQERFKKS